MVRITLDIKKSVEQNAEIYFEKAKKAKSKAAGAKKALATFQKKLDELLEKQDVVAKKTQVHQTKVHIKKEWYEKFRWFITSDGFLVIGGRDATTNEIVIKKYTEAKDIVFHTDMAGSPFLVIKADKKEITKTAINEAADATCSFSRAWKMGLPTQSVFYVSPSQVTKEANAGEFLTKGAFMIRGKTN